MKQAVGENVAAFRVGRELDLVDGDEIGVESSGIASTVQT